MNTSPQQAQVLDFSSPSVAFMKLAQAIINGRLDDVRSCIKKKIVGVDDNNNTLGFTPLHTATVSGHLDIVKYLVLEAKASVDMIDLKQNTPLFYAFPETRRNILHFLVREGKANVNFQDKDKSGLLHLAAEKGDKELVAFLINEAKADLKIQDIRGNTALHYAAGFGKLEVLALLLKNKECLNTKNYEHGFTPLHVAIVNEHLKAAQLIVEAGADVNSQDNAGMTPLHIAYSIGDTAAINYLISQAHADPMILDKQGLKPNKYKPCSSFVPKVVDEMQYHQSQENPALSKCIDHLTRVKHLLSLGKKKEAIVEGAKFKAIFKELPEDNYKKILHDEYVELQKKHKGLKSEKGVSRKTEVISVSTAQAPGVDKQRQDIQSTPGIQKTAERSAQKEKAAEKEVMEQKVPDARIKEEKDHKSDVKDQEASQTGKQKEIDLKNSSKKESDPKTGNKEEKASGTVKMVAQKDSDGSKLANKKNKKKHKKNKNKGKDSVVTIKSPHKSGEEVNPGIRAKSDIKAKSDVKAKSDIKATSDTSINANPGVSEKFISLDEEDEKPQQSPSEVFQDSKATKVNPPVAKTEVATGASRLMHDEARRSGSASNPTPAVEIVKPIIDQLIAKALSQITEAKKVAAQVHAQNAPKEGKVSTQTLFSHKDERAATHSNPVSSRLKESGSGNPLSQSQDYTRNSRPHKDEKSSHVSSKTSDINAVDLPFLFDGCSEKPLNVLYSLSKVKRFEKLEIKLSQTIKNQQQLQSFKTHLLPKIKFEIWNDAQNGIRPRKLKLLQERLDDLLIGNLSSTLIENLFQLELFSAICPKTYAAIARMRDISAEILKWWQAELEPNQSSTFRYQKLAYCALAIEAFEKFKSTTNFALGAYPSKDYIQTLIKEDLLLTACVFLGTQHYNKVNFVDNEQDWNSISTLLNVLIDRFRKMPSTKSTVIKEAQPRSSSSNGTLASRSELSREKDAPQKSEIIPSAVKHEVKRIVAQDESSSITQNSKVSSTPQVASGSQTTSGTQTASSSLMASSSQSTSSSFKVTISPSSTSEEKSAIETYFEEWLAKPHTFLEAIVKLKLNHDESIEQIVKAILTTPKYYPKLHLVFCGISSELWNPENLTVKVDSIAIYQPLLKNLFSDLSPTLNNFHVFNLIFTLNLWDVLFPHMQVAFSALHSKDTTHFFYELTTVRKWMMSELTLQRSTTVQGEAVFENFVHSLLAVPFYALYRLFAVHVPDQKFVLMHADKIAQAAKLFLQKPGYDNPIANPALLEAITRKLHQLIEFVTATYTSTINSTIETSPISGAPEEDQDEISDQLPTVSPVTTMSAAEPALVSVSEISTTVSDTSAMASGPLDPLASASAELRYYKKIIDKMDSTNLESQFPIILGGIKNGDLLNLSREIYDSLCEQLQPKLLESREVVEAILDRAKDLCQGSRAKEETIACVCLGILSVQINASQLKRTKTVHQESEPAVTVPLTQSTVSHSISTQSVGSQSIGTQSTYSMGTDGARSYSASAAQYTYPMGPQSFNSAYYQTMPGYAISPDAYASVSGMMPPGYMPATPVISSVPTFTPYYQTGYYGQQPVAYPPPSPPQLPYVPPSPMIIQSAPSIPQASTHQPLTYPAPTHSLDTPAHPSSEDKQSYPVPLSYSEPVRPSRPPMRRGVAIPSTQPVQAIPQSGEALRAAPRSQHYTNGHVNPHSFMGKPKAKPEQLQASTNGQSSTTAAASDSKTGDLRA